MIPLRDINPAATTPYVNYALIASCVAVFGYQLASGLESSAYVLGAIPLRLTGAAEVAPEYDVLAAPLTMLTSMFAHGSIMHIGGNLLFLWVFGDNVEDALGHVKYVAFYLLAGLLAAGSHLAVNLSSPLPMVGASGAISGVMGAYVVLYPRARVLTLVPIFYFFRLMELPAFVVLGLWFVFQILSGAISAASAGGGVAYGAHVGGFIAGVVLVRVFARRPERRPRVTS